MAATAAMRVIHDHHPQAPKGAVIFVFLRLGHRREKRALAGALEAIGALMPAYRVEATT